MDVDLARVQWHDGIRRVEGSRRELDRYVSLMQQVDVVIGGLRQRMGQNFTLDELASAYDGADDWARTLLDDADPEGGPVLAPGTVADAAFHLFARGAADYTP